MLVFEKIIITLRRKCREAAYARPLMQASWHSLNRSIAPTMLNKYD